MPALPTLPHTSELELFFSCSLRSPYHRRSSLSPLKRQGLPEGSLFFPRRPRAHAPSLPHIQESCFLGSFSARPFQLPSMVTAAHRPPPAPPRGGLCPAGGAERRPAGRAPEPRGASPERRPRPGPTSDVHSRHGRTAHVRNGAVHRKRPWSGRDGAGAERPGTPLVPTRTRWPGKQVPEAKGCTAPASHRKSK